MKVVLYFPPFAGRTCQSFLFSAAMLCGSISSQAALTVTVSAVPGEPAFVTSAGTAAVPDGTYFQLGTFPVQPTLADLAENPGSGFLQWQEFTDGTPGQTFSIDSFVGNAAGDYYGDDAFVGKSIYWWVFLTSDGQSPALDFSNVTEHTLFTGPSANLTFVPGEAVPPVVFTADNLTFFAGGLNGTSGNVQLGVVPAGRLASINAGHARPASPPLLSRVPG